MRKPKHFQLSRRTYRNTRALVQSNLHRVKMRRAACAECLRSATCEENVRRASFNCASKLAGAHLLEQTRGGILGQGTRVRI